MAFGGKAYPGLVPGYKQVEEFGSDEEYESEEEVSYVTLDLGSIEPTLVPSSSTYRLIGLDTPTPFLQLSGTILKGRHESLLGTELIFTEGKDINDKGKRAAVHVANTEQRICFREVQLQPKDIAEAPSLALPDQEADQPEKLGDALPIDPALKEEEASTLNRLTGKEVPRPRSPRTTRKKSDAQTQARKKGKGKGKGKARDAEETVDQNGDDDMDDMYVDDV